MLLQILLMIFRCSEYHLNLLGFQKYRDIFVQLHYILLLRQIYDQATIFARLESFRFSNEPEKSVLNYNSFSLNLQ